MLNKRILLLIVLLASLMASLAACGGGQTAPAAESDSGADADVVEEQDEGTTTEEQGEGATEEETVEEPAAEPTAQATATLAEGKEQVTMWSHSAGNPNEIAVVEQMIEAFNAQNQSYQVVLESFPQASYNDSVAAASVAGSLPCIVDLDAPTVPNFAWSGYIQPLPITDAELEELEVLEADVGSWQDEVYSLGQFDVALLIYGRQSVLEEHGIRIPTLDEPWTLEEFNQTLETLKSSGDFEYALDVNAASTGEWWSYAYSPMLQSFGGDLINRENYQEAEGVLNGPEAVAWGEWFQGLFENGYAPANPADDQGFLQGEIALWYTGSWSAQAVTDAYGDDALFLPPPDFGNGPKIGAGSWQLGVSTTCEHPEGAADFILFTMQPEQVALMSEATSLIPTTSGGAAQTEEYAEGGAFRIFYDMAERYALIRPPTPGYLTLSSQFEQAGLSIRDGGNVQDALDDAVDAIERNIEDNDGYGFSE